MTLTELKEIEASIGERKGWDFSVMKTETDPTPWEYSEVVKKYLKPTDYVLDLGTGGGERFLQLADNFAKGIGVDSDPEMIETAKSKAPQNMANKVSFEVMDAEHLTFSNSTFDAIIDRQGPTPVNEIVRVLKPGGYFITQMVGQNNIQNINHEFDPSFVLESKLVGEAKVLAEEFKKHGCSIMAICSYNVDYYVKDVASMLFWLKAIRSRSHATSAIPEDFNVEKYYQHIVNLLANSESPKGYKTNEHRELLVVRKN